MSSVYWTHHHDPRSTTRDEGACALLDRRAGRSRDQACRLDIYRDTTTLTPAATVSMSRRPGLGAWALLGLIVLGAAALRLRLLDVPLDRDEGEYGYFAQLLLQGVPPYAQAYNLKLPGIYGVYAAILAAFGLFAVVYTLLGGVSPGVRGDFRRRFLPAGAVVAGALAPLALVCAVLAGAGVFDRFWFWTVTYALHYASAVPLTTGVVLFAHKAGELLAASYLVAILAAVGVSALVWHPEARQRRAFVLLLALLSLCGTSAGLYFRNQYFVLLLPSVALLAGLGVDALAGSVARGTLRRGLAAALTAVPLVAFLFAERVILWEAPPERGTRELFGLSPFPESVEIARYLRSRTAEGE